MKQARREPNTMSGAGEAAQPLSARQLLSRLLFVALERGDPSGAQRELARLNAIIELADSHPLGT